MDGRTCMDGIGWAGCVWINGISLDETDEMNGMRVHGTNGRKDRCNISYTRRSVSSDIRTNIQNESVFEEKIGFKFDEILC